jgi:flagellar motility protein MotE (MotC chaperone)
MQQLSYEVIVRPCVLMCLLLLASIVCFSNPCLAQDSNAPASAEGADPQFGRQRNQRTRDELQIERDMEKARNKERQEKLKQDTDQLLKLATELKEYVDKTNEHVLSLDVLKKTDEIGKLAKSIHDKMKAQ